MKALAAEIAKDLKTPEDLSVLSAQLTKITVEAALNAELEHHLGYTSHERKGRKAATVAMVTAPKALRAIMVQLN